MGCRSDKGQALMETLLMFIVFGTCTFAAIVYVLLTALPPLRQDLLPDYMGDRHVCSKARSTVCR